MGTNGLPNQIVTAPASITYPISGSGTATSLAPWYWNDTPSVNWAVDTVTCVVTLTPPASESLAPLTTTISQNVYVYSPIITNNVIQTSTVEEIVNPSLYGYNGMTGNWLMALYPLPNPNNESPAPAEPGISWKVAVAGPNSAFSNGTATVAQLWGYSIDTSAFGSSQAILGLDNTYPYAAWNDPWASNDAPNVGLSGSTSASMSDQFQDYLMYTPPPCSANPQIPVSAVPIGYFAWSAAGSWTDSGGTTGCSITPSGTASFALSNAWPTWTIINSNTGTPQ
jgi:hypothetical protein